MSNTPMTCIPHRTTKTARVWNNAIRKPACGYARQSMSLYPNPRIPIFKFLRTRSSSKCLIQEHTKIFSTIILIAKVILCLCGNTHRFARVRRETILFEMTRASRNWCERQNKRNY